MKGNGAAGGLEGVVAADTRLSEVDGERGRLILAGHDVETLAGRVTFEDACALLWRGALPDRAGRETLRAALADARQAAFARLGDLGDALGADDGMDALRAALAHLRLRDDDPAAVTGAAAVFAAAWARGRAGQAPVAPDAALAHAADYLRMARGDATAAPPPTLAGALDAYLVTVCDHGLNASTFAARVVASTASDLVSAVVAAVGALKGPLHGGAPGPVLDMLDAVGAPARARAWLESELAAGRRIMGMGHRIYRVRDPRAAVLEAAVERLERAAADAGAEVAPIAARLALARAVEREAEAVLKARHPDRALRANVEFYTAVVLEAVGLPRPLFTPTFAVSRVAGWCAHVLEQRATGRLIRPASRYVGPRP
ncbi:MAG TPA: citrate synthase [Myxococcota bacterium]|jgi:citrate synthase|nr:citrate synthase [Myxococcota bacterium]